jgi:putative hemolysin
MADRRAEAARCREAGLQVETDFRNEKINYKVREHSLAKVPVILVCGMREAEEQTVNIRPVDFEETKEALKTNMATRKEALKLLEEGTTIIVFPGGGVATAQKPFGRAEELPWKTFTAKMIRSSKATVLPIHFEGQNSWLFHLVSRFSLTLRLSLYVREFRRTLGQAIRARAGAPIPYETISGFKDQKEVMDFLQSKVMEMAPAEQKERLLSRH